MSITKVTEFLDSHHIHYEVIKHPLAYTAQEIAAAAHIPGRQLAKTVMLKIDGVLAMVVLPAPERVNFERLKAYTQARKVELAKEAEFKAVFPECDTGAMPPFGNLYGMRVFASESLADEIEITFCGGSHTDLVRMAYTDFVKLVNPEVLDLSWSDTVD